MRTFCHSIHQCNLFQWKQCATSILMEQWSNVSLRQKSNRNQGTIQEKSDQENLKRSCWRAWVYGKILKKSDSYLFFLKIFFQRDIWKIQETKRSAFCFTSKPKQKSRKGSVTEWMETKSFIVLSLNKKSNMQRHRKRQKQIKIRFFEKFFYFLPLLYMQSRHWIREYKIWFLFFELKIVVYKKERMT